jgi:hypothetical protein
MAPRYRRCIRRSRRQVPVQPSPDIAALLTAYGELREIAAVSTGGRRHRLTRLAIGTDLFFPGGIRVEVGDARDNRTPLDVTW